MVDSDQWSLPKTSCQVKESILFHKSWYFWLWQRRIAWPVNAVNRKPLCKFAETVWHLVADTFHWLWALQLLTYFHTSVSFKVIIKSTLSSNRCVSPACSQDCPEKVASFGVRGMIIPCFSKSAQRFRSEKPWPKGCAVLLPRWVYPRVTAAEQEAKPAWSQLFHCLVKAKALLPQPWNVS